MGEGEEERGEPSEGGNGEECLGMNGDSGNVIFIFPSS